MQPHFIVKVILFGLSVFVLSKLATAEEISRVKIEEIRQLAIESGQTSSPSDPKPTKSQEEQAAERAAIESHRKAFFERTYGRRQK